MGPADGPDAGGQNANKPNADGPEDGTNANKPNADGAWLSARVAEHHSPNPCGGARMLQRFTAAQD